MSSPSGMLAIPDKNQPLRRITPPRRNTWAGTSEKNADRSRESDLPRWTTEWIQRATKLQPEKKYIDPERTVEDISTEYDRGYDADIDGQLPNETEEPDSESESESGGAIPVTPSSLVRDFRNLHCEPEEEDQLAQSNRHRIPNDNFGNSSLKRSHSEDSLTDTDEDASERDLSSTREHHRLKRRLKVPDSHPANSTPNNEGDDMEIDEATTEITSDNR